MRDTPIRIEETLYIAYVSSALRLMYSKIAKAAMHEIPWNAKPTFSSASVISADALPRQNRQFLLAVARKKFLPPPQNPGIQLIENGGPTRTLENPAPLFSRLGCADDAIASFPSRLPSTPAPVVVYDGGRRVRAMRRRKGCGRLEQNGACCCASFRASRPPSVSWISPSFLSVVPPAHVHGLHRQRP